MNESAHSKRLVLLLGVLSAFPPLSTDMYLPAIPLLQKLWNQPLSVVNLTLVGFFVTYCFFLLIYGPISDRYGRRRPMLVGIAIYVIASMCCAIASNVTFLIVFRMIQAAGAASASAIALAVCKDVYSGHERGRILAYISVIMALAPMLAPIIGGWIMSFTSWRSIFVIQGSAASLAWFGVLSLPETLETPSASNARAIFGTYLTLLQNKRFIGLTLMLVLIAVPHFSFIGGSADIYITGFGLSEKTFGYFFALNASAFLFGSMTCAKLNRHIGSNGLLIAGFAGIMIAGACMLIPWTSSPWRLALPMFWASFSYGLSRPPSNNLILDQVDQHAGAASSLMVFSYFMVGALAMWVISLEWVDKVSLIGTFGLTICGTLLVFWLLISKRFFRIETNTDQGEV